MVGLSSFFAVALLSLWWACNRRGGRERRQPDRVPSSILSSVFILAPDIKYLNTPVCLCVAAHCGMHTCHHSLVIHPSLRSCCSFIVSFRMSVGQIAPVILLRFIYLHSNWCLLFSHPPWTFLSPGCPPTFPFILSFCTFLFLFPCFCCFTTPSLSLCSGMGDMAVSNSIGSNVFDILVGLGLPWALKTLAINYGSDVGSILTRRIGIYQSFNITQWTVINLTPRMLNMVSNISLMSNLNVNMLIDKISKQEKKHWYAPEIKILKQACEKIF